VRGDERRAIDGKPWFVHHAEGGSYSPHIGTESVSSINDGTPPARTALKGLTRLVTSVEQFNLSAVSP
jgi:hypothetical protein